MKWRILLIVMSAILAAVAIAWPRDQFVASGSPADWASTPANIARGAYLARAGDCVACHTARGGVPYAGGRALATPFGTLYGPNLTPDNATGLGRWSADAFWGALHNGRSKDGRYLYPAFPFPHYTKTTRADSDALYAYLRSLAPTQQANRPHAMEFPFDTQLALAGWRLFFFRPAVYAPMPARDAAWNRGAYLVEGLGHCSACHSARNVVGASTPGLTGGMIPVLNWYAPSLAGTDMPQAELVQLLHTGVAPNAAVIGPMAEVVARSLQYLSPDDIGAMAVYLHSLPPGDAEAGVTIKPSSDAMTAGAAIYRQHCIACHGSDGRGFATAYPPLAGNRTLTTTQPVNAIRIVLQGGFPPGTAGNPRPYGMPPFAHVLDDAEVAQVLTYVRSSWGNRGGEVSAAQVNRYRGAGLD
ncbi:MAG: cytochrome c [Pseudomonadota bacterium]|nr:cytochrome c [Pseudomonadota bacterium]